MRRYHTLRDQQQLVEPNAVSSTELAPDAAPLFEIPHPRLGIV